MRAVVQRVTRAGVTVAGEVVDQITRPGLLVLLGVTHDDDETDLAWLVAKLSGLRIMRDEKSVLEAGGCVLVVSQFTLYADVRKGRRPSWSAAAPGPVAEPAYDAFCDGLAAAGVCVHRGSFGADMAVDLLNDGPVTLVIDTPPHAT